MHLCRQVPYYWPTAIFNDSLVSKTLCYSITLIETLCIKEQGWVSITL